MAKILRRLEMNYIKDDTEYLPPTQMSVTTTCDYSLNEDGLTKCVCKGRPKDGDPACEKNPYGHKKMRSILCLHYREDTHHCDYTDESKK